MLKLAWYLITEDDFLNDPTAPPAPPEAWRLADRLRTVFGDHPEMSPARTHTAVRVMVAAAEHLTDVVGHFRPAISDDAQAARLLLGLNLLCAHVAQSTGRLAHHADTHTAGTDLSDADRRLLTEALATACCRLEEAAGLFKEAHLTLTSPRHSGRASR